MSEGKDRFKKKVTCRRGIEINEKHKHFQAAVNTNDSDRMRVDGVLDRDCRNHFCEII